MNAYNNITTQSDNIYLNQYPLELQPVGNEAIFEFKSKEINSGQSKCTLSFNINTLTTGTDFLLIDNVYIRASTNPTSSNFYKSGGGNTTITNVAESIVNSINNNYELNYRLQAISNSNRVIIVSKVYGTKGNFTYTIPTNATLYQFNAGINKRYDQQTNNFGVYIDLFKSSDIQFGWNNVLNPINSGNWELVTTLQNDYDINNSYKFDISSILKGYANRLNTSDLLTANLYKSYSFDNYSIKFGTLSSSEGNTYREKNIVGENKYFFYYPASFNIEETVSTVDFYNSENNYYYLQINFNPLIPSYTVYSINGKNFGVNLTSNYAAFTAMIDVQVNELIKPSNFGLTYDVWRSGDSIIMKAKTAGAAGAVTFASTNTAYINFLMTPATSAQFNLVKPLNFQNKTINCTAGPSMNASQLLQVVNFIYKHNSNYSTTANVKVRYILYDGTVSNWYSTSVLILDQSGIYSCLVDLNQSEWTNNGDGVDIVEYAEVAVFLDDIQYTDSISYNFNELPTYIENTQLIFINHFGGFETLQMDIDNTSAERSTSYVTTKKSLDIREHTKRQIDIDLTLNKLLVKSAIPTNEVDIFKDLLKSDRVWLYENGLLRAVVVDGGEFKYDTGKELYDLSVKIDYISPENNI